MKNTHFKALFTSLWVIVLTACAGGGGKATRYYLIDTVAFEPLTATDVAQNGAKDISIEIIDLHIPQYLERFQIATRAGAGRLAFSDYHQWGENLRKNLLRTMARNLSKLLDTHDIGTPMNRSASIPDYRLQVYIEQFELDVDNNVKLIARWQLTKTGQQQPQSIAIFGFESQENELQGNYLQEKQTIASGDYDHMVAVMRQLYGQLSEEIAATILTTKVNN